MRRAPAFVLPLVLYVASAYRDVMYWDIGELDTVPYILGIAHPPGMPLYTLIGWAFTHLVPIGSVAFRMSLLSALAMAAAAWVAATIVADETGDELAGVAAALLFACGGAVWAHATRAEVHAFATLAFALVALFSLRWQRRGRSADFYAMMLSFAGGVAIHPVVFFALAGIMAVVILRASDELDARLLLQGSALAIVTIAACYAYLPLRSEWIDAHGADPLEPYGVSGSAFWDYDDPAHFDGFMTLVTGSNVAVATNHFGATNGAFVLGVAQFVRTSVAEFTPPGIIICAIGLVVFFRRSVARASLAALVLLPSALFGCAFAAESDPQRYWLPAFAFFAIGAGIACASARRLRIAAIAATCLIAIALILTQRNFFNQPHDDRAVTEANEVLRTTPSDAIVVATWVIAPPLAYDAYVLHETGRRIIVPEWYGDVQDQLASWCRNRPVFVAGTPEGSVPGFQLERAPTITQLYRVTPCHGEVRAQRASNQRVHRR